MVRQSLEFESEWKTTESVDQRETVRVESQEEIEQMPGIERCLIFRLFNF